MNSFIVNPNNYEAFIPEYILMNVIQDTPKGELITCSFIHPKIGLTRISTTAPINLNRGDLVEVEIQRAVIGFVLRGGIKVWRCDHWN